MKNAEFRNVESEARFCVFPHPLRLHSAFSIHNSAFAMHRSNLKLFRDPFAPSSPQALAVALVMACGLSMMIMARKPDPSFRGKRRATTTTATNRFAQVFARLKRAPNSAARGTGENSRRQQVQTGISMLVYARPAGH